MQSVVQKNTLERVTLKRNVFGKKETVNISYEDLEIVSTLEFLKRELDFSHGIFEYITDPTLIDSTIYEIMSLNMRYKYYLNLCKERGLVSDGF